MLAFLSEILLGVTQPLARIIKILAAETVQTAEVGMIFLLTVVDFVI